MSLYTSINPVWPDRSKDLYIHLKREILKTIFDPVISVSARQEIFQEWLQQYLTKTNADPLFQTIFPPMRQQQL